MLSYCYLFLSSILIVHGQNDVNDGKILVKEKTSFPILLMGVFMFIDPYRTNSHHFTQQYYCQRRSGSVFDMQNTRCIDNSHELLLGDERRCDETSDGDDN